MPRDVKAQLRITAWPSFPLPLPFAVRRACDLDQSEGVLVPHPVELADELLIEGAKVTWAPIERADWIEPTGETYLRLAELDLSDAHAIHVFATRYGLLGGSVAYTSLQRHLGFFESHIKSQLDPRDEWRKKAGALRDEFVRSGHSLTRLPANAPGSLLDDHITAVLTDVPPAIETLDEFRFAARCVRDLYTAWLVVKHGRDLRELQWEALTHTKRHPTLYEAATLLDHVLTVFLRDFSPQLQLEWLFAGPAKAGDLFASVDSVSIDPTTGPQTAPLYAICALELFNHILSDAEYHECANDRCKRTFVQQQGRSEKGQHRTRGVMYCTAECARAAAQRQYRRRRRGSQ